MPKPQYGKAHQTHRKQLAPTVAAGQAQCTEPICLMPTRWITPGSEWDLAHDRTRPGQYHGPAHAVCNRTEGGRNAKGEPPITRWPALLP